MYIFHLASLVFFDGVSCGRIKDYVIIRISLMSFWLYYSFWRQNVVYFGAKKQFDLVSKGNLFWRQKVVCFSAKTQCVLTPKQSFVLAQIIGMSVLQKL